MEEVIYLQFLQIMLSFINFIALAYLNLKLDCFHFLQSEYQSQSAQTINQFDTFNFHLKVFNLMLSFH